MTQYRVAHNRKMKIGDAVAWRWVMWVFAIVLMSTSALATPDIEKETEIRADKTGVRVKAWVGDEGGKPVFSVNEQVILSIDVSTSRWFTGGTRIGRVDIPNVIAKQRNQLATNYTTREQGQTWSYQRWEITLYPQQSGRFTIPPISVNVQVSGEDGQNVRGLVQTSPVRFEARLPSGLLTQESVWFAASKADVRQVWQSSTDTLHVGDAVTRTITITAQDSLSVLLPDLMATETSGANAASSQRGYQAYAQPHQLNDTQTRGDYQSSRTEQTVYILQMGGDIQFPDYTFFWWDTQRQILQTVTVAGKSFHIAHTWRSWLAYYWPILASVIISLLVLMGGLWALRRYFQTHPKPERWQLWQLLRKGQWAQARVLIYRRLRLNGGELEISQARAGRHFPSWGHDSVSFQQEESASLALYHRLWRQVAKRVGHHRRLWRLPKALPTLENLPKPLSNKGRAK